MSSKQGLWTHDALSNTDFLQPPAPIPVKQHSPASNDPHDYYTGATVLLEQDQHIPSGAVPQTWSQVHSSSAERTSDSNWSAAAGGMVKMDSYPDGGLAQQNNDHRLRTRRVAQNAPSNLSTIAENYPSPFLSNSLSTTYSPYSSITASGATSTSRTSDELRSNQLPKKKILSIHRMSKVEAAQRKQLTRTVGGGILPAVTKWLVTILMAVVLLGCLVITKVEVLILSRHLNDSLPMDGDKIATTRYLSNWIIMYLFLSVPVLFNLLRTVWFGLLDSTVPWPGRRSVLMAFLSVGLECIGLCLMCYKVLGRYESPLSMILLNTPVILPAIDNIRCIQRLHRKGSATIYVLVLAFLGAILSIGGVIPLTIYFAKKGVDASIWHLLVGVVTLSLGWMPVLQKKLVTPREMRPDPPVGIPFTVNGYSEQKSADRNNCMQTNTISGMSTISEPNDRSAVNTSLETVSESNCTSSSEDNTDVTKVSPTWKVSFITHCLKLVYIFLFSIIFLCLDSRGTFTNVFTNQVHMAFLDAWDFSLVEDSTWRALGLGLCAGFMGYTFAFAACYMNITRLTLVPPLLLASPLALVAVGVTPVCTTLFEDIHCSWGDVTEDIIVIAALFFFLAHVFAFGWYHSRKDPVLLQQESVVFWVPGYNCVSLDTWLLLNHCPRVRRWPTTAHLASDQPQPKVFICTTMYREEEEEMRQVLESINEINKAQTAGKRFFESHIILDGGVRQKEPTEFALQLISLLKETLGVTPEHCTKVETPYGLKLSWALPGDSSKIMPFNIHLKDNFLVKNKKRWSQVMYMSYVLDFLAADENESFILTTDADVVFKPGSVEALLDLMTRDGTIGAVCARTHPMGSGALVWYQIFEYAIGHWFQKTAEHMLGSVLCAPGCFSVYRCSALADVLPIYAGRVETAFDFLTKDMGEDRWLCTLLVQSGWRIEYCAASENSTNCPNEFEEFYKQRRRWVASTIANLMLIIKEWKFVRMLNHRVSNLFLMYQGLLLFSTLIGPSTIILVVTGGLAYAWNVDPVADVVVQYLLCISYALVCIYTTQPTHLKIAKIYTFVYAIVMTAVVVGTAIQIVGDFQGSINNALVPNRSESLATSTMTPARNLHISVDLPISVATLYLSILAGIFVLAAILHPREFLCLLHGVWYLLCLPSGYLILTIYSVCNITDSTWGTREQNDAKSAVKRISWQQRVKDFMGELFFCCIQQRRMLDADTQTEMFMMTPPSAPQDFPTSSEIQTKIPSAPQDPEQENLNGDVSPELETLPVEDWLPLEMRGLYVKSFKEHGFDNTLFIAGMTEKELRRLGVTSQGHLHYLLSQIALIPAFEIEYAVPTNVNEWLEDIGLEMYRDNFKRNKIHQPKEMEILKSFSREDIEKELGIIKDGHIKRLKYAISKLKDPTERQQKAMRMRQIVDEMAVHYLKQSNAQEHAFWDKLIKTCLKPDLKAFGLEGEVKSKLADLRNNWLLILAVSNTLWLIVIMTLAAQSSLTVLDTNPLGLFFLVVFGALFAIQFLTMLMHRLATFSHYLARAPYRCGEPFQSDWSFRSDALEDSADRTAQLQLKRDSANARTRLLTHGKSRRGRRSRLPTPDESCETLPLIGP